LTASLGIRLQVGASKLRYFFRNPQDEQAHQMPVLITHTNPELFGLSYRLAEAERPTAVACPSFVQ